MRDTNLRREKIKDRGEMDVMVADQIFGSVEWLVVPFIKN